jgi:hypothetical protein
VEYPKTLRVLAQSVAEHEHVKLKRVRIVQKTLMLQEFLPILKKPASGSEAGYAMGILCKVHLSFLLNETKNALQVLYMEKSSIPHRLKKR